MIVGPIKSWIGSFRGPLVDILMDCVHCWPGLLELLWSSSWSIEWLNITSTRGSAALGVTFFLIAPLPETFPFVTFMVCFTIRNVFLAFLPMFLWLSHAVDVGCFSGCSVGCGGTSSIPCRNLTFSSVGIRSSAFIHCPYFSILSMVESVLQNMIGCPIRSHTKQTKGSFSYRTSTHNCRCKFALRTQKPGTN